MSTLSIRQPWIELILHGWKDVEHPTRRILEPEPLVLHASVNGKRAFAG
ncbi:hypothetical protein [Marinithermus hydrothermalis]|uniref:ASCH domain-containing protein n=1 Tax=Marinithermus hydrothermalis (strain DSM 14884 / JCM 11576 / T1) TaxID=869210 RepID=F2NK80_MARHT|nr:hypothetical protein [Marinithermus hydrothermalis]AEB12051.1 hypothetical protein Marky_1314 [Marinithermus hydrothermalis DSM 14884]